MLIWSHVQGFEVRHSLATKTTTTTTTKVLVLFFTFFFLHLILIVQKKKIYYQQQVKEIYFIDFQIYYALVSEFILNDNFWNLLIFICLLCGYIWIFYGYIWWLRW